MAVAQSLNLVEETLVLCLLLPQQRALVFVELLELLHVEAVLQLDKRLFELVLELAVDQSVLVLGQASVNVLLWKKPFSVLGPLVEATVEFRSERLQRRLSNLSG